MNPSLVLGLLIGLVGMPIFTLIILNVYWCCLLQDEDIDFNETSRGTIPSHPSTVTAPAVLFTKGDKSKSNDDLLDQEEMINLRRIGIEVL